MATTTTAIGSTPAVTPVKTGTTAVQTATNTLLTSLNSGSGVDTATLVTSLVEAQFATRSARLTTEDEKLTSQISGVSTIKSAISVFASSLDSLAKSGTLTASPVSSAAGVLTASVLPGQRVPTAATTLKVDRLAAAQMVATAAITNPAAPDAKVTRATVLGSGTFTIQPGAATTATDADGTTRMTGFTPADATVAPITFSLTDATVDSIAAAINAQGARLGISATVVTAADGTPYLSMKGQTGTASGFTVAVTGTTPADQAALNQFTVGPDGTLPLTQAAQNARLTVDGITVERTSNTVDDLVSGLSLKLTAPGVTSLTSTRQTEALTQAVTDIADAYNTVLEIINEQTNPLTGPLAADPAAQSLLRQLKALTLKPLNLTGAAGEPRTLAELGIKTEQKGTLTVDKKALAATLAKYPAAVETMFAESSVSKTGLPGVMKAMSDGMNNVTVGLGASTLRYTNRQISVTQAKTKVASESITMTDRLTQQYASMNSRISAYKATQKYMEEQVKAWNKTD